MDDDFKLGIQINPGQGKGTGASRGAYLRMYCDFFQSDIIIASPLGLRLLIEKNSSGNASGNGKLNADFLSSLEVVFLHQSDVLYMQNWEHVEYIMSRTNKLAENDHGTDFSRIRPYILEGKSAEHRQLIITTQFNDPIFQSFFRTHGHSMAGIISFLNFLSFLLFFSPFISSFLFFAFFTVPFFLFPFLSYTLFLSNSPLFFFCCSPALPFLCFSLLFTFTFSSLFYCHSFHFPFLLSLLLSFFSLSLSPLSFPVILLIFPFSSLFYCHSFHFPFLLSLLLSFPFSSLFYCHSFNFPFLLSLLLSFFSLFLSPLSFTVILFTFSFSSLFYCHSFHFPFPLSSLFSCRSAL